MYVSVYRSLWTSYQSRNSSPMRRQSIQGNITCRVKWFLLWMSNNTMNVILMIQIEQDRNDTNVDWEPYGKESIQKNALPRLSVDKSASSSPRPRPHPSPLISKNTSKSIILHQLSHTLQRLRYPRLKYHFERQRVGVGGFCECQFVDGGWMIGFDLECPLHEDGVYINGST